jgi:hypothetical protein
MPRPFLSPLAANAARGSGFVFACAKFNRSHPLPPEFTLSAVEGADSPSGRGRKETDSRLCAQMVTKYPPGKE